MTSRGVRVSRWLGTAAIAMFGVTVASVVATWIGVTNAPYTTGSEYAMALPIFAGVSGILVTAILGVAAIVVRMFSKAPPEEDPFSWRRRGKTAFFVAVIAATPFLTWYEEYLRGG